MKTLAALLIIIGTFQFASGMDFGETDRHSGMFFGPTVKLSQLHSETAVWLGGKVGWRVGDNLGVGGALSNLMTRHNLPALRAEPTGGHINLTYIGALLEYDFSPDRPHGIGFDLLWGSGWSEVVVHDPMQQYYYNTSYSPPFMVFEPTLFIYRRVPHAILTLGLSTMLLSGTQVPEFEDGDFTRPMLNFGVGIE